ncbi:Hypothetical protein SSA_0142 [Streptococcus sanguinis SK36]|uniref:Lipoprotein n=1 Tax=Streptococcus sanguinis (strain SK36) TaxID=388919 RepID=A3CK99_STRSV|nr:Hypothetical protein SSA_0142 [Streptococcus sanguinis SK36]
MKKKALPFLLAGAALLAMTACSNGSATNQSETTTSSTGSVTSSGGAGIQSINCSSIFSS